MKIIAIKVHILKVPKNAYHWRQGHLPGGPERDAMLLRVLTDQGVEGNCFSISRGQMMGDYIDRILKPLVIGENAFDREYIWQKLWEIARSEPSMRQAQAYLDVALWDLAAKAANLPLYQYIGAYRHKVKAYASTFTLDSIQDYIDLANDCVKRGYKAIKLHVFGEVKKDIEVCRAVRKTVGDKIDLMLDASGAYSREEALWAGRELEKLNFLWFEEPLRDYQMYSLRDLNHRLDIPLNVAESNYDTLYDVANQIIFGTGSIIHAGWPGKGGITPILKIAHLCEGFGVKCQLHRGEIPSIHVACAIKNCIYVERIVPEDSFHFCLKYPPIVPDQDGYIIPPEGPGLGYDIDWEEIKKYTVREI